MIWSSVNAAMARSEHFIEQGRATQPLQQRAAEKNWSLKNIYRHHRIPHAD